MPLSKATDLLGNNNKVNGVAMEGIDRVLFNCSCQFLFPNFVPLALLAVASNQSLIIVKLFV